MRAAWLPLLALGCSKPEPHDTLATAVQLAEQGEAEWQPEGLYFSWIQTVWAYGVSRVGAATGDPVHHDYNAVWMGENVGDFVGDDPQRFESSDSMSPAGVASIAMMEDPSDDWTPITDAAHTYLAELPRLDNGAFPHWSPDDTLGPPDQLWVDSQFMIGLFLLHEWQRTGDEAHLDELVAQYFLASDLCRDPGDHLYRHAWDDVGGANIPAEATYWARGNAWVLVIAAEILAVMPGDHAERDALLDAFLAHADAVAALQDDDGLWHTVLNEPNGDDPLNYTETSASALIVYALVRAGDDAVGDRYEDAIDRGVAGLRSRIRENPDGTLTVGGTSYGTNPGDYDYYVSVGTADDLMLGIGTVVMALAEVHDTPRPR